MDRRVGEVMEEKPYRLPLVIGATGHRDLRDRDIPALEEAVADAVKRLKRDYLHDDPETPLVVLSSLAEGADRLIARVAMHLGAKLIAPLPMEADEYRRDFEPGLKAAAAAEFDRMKGDALATPVMRFAEGNTRVNVHEEARRALQYRAVGLFIVRHCHVLIALWNGDERDPAVGGTAEVVSYKRDGVQIEAAASVRASLNVSETGPVIHIVTPRAKPGGNVTEVRTEPWGIEFVARYRALHKTRELSPAERRQFESWVAFEGKAASMCRFNREAAKFDAASNNEARLNASLSHIFDNSAA
jgi:hypothetical protein